MKLRSLQFWVLFLGSLFICLLFYKQITLSKTLYSQRRSLVDNEEIAQSGAAYQTAWKQLAVRIYQGSHDDPALTTILKDQGVAIGTTPPPAPAPAPSTATKNPAPAAPTHP